MANIIQKMIYNFSAFAPLCFIFSILWFLQKHTRKVPILFLCIGVILIFCLACSFSYGKKHVAPIIIQVTDISPYDNWIVAYIISYLLPFASMAIKDFDMLVSGIIAAILILVVPFVNSSIPNPLLFLRGYHFYQVSSENGVSGYTLICKRNLRKAKDVRRVQRIFEFVLLDSEE